MKLSENQIYQALNLLGISTNNKRNGNWLSILCPLHHDKNYGNAFINLEGGGIHCFSCKESTSIVKLIQQNHNTSFKGALKLLGDTSSIPIYCPEIKKKKVETKVIIQDFISVDFDPKEYLYTNQRGFTKEFCDEFDIKRCISNVYNDYMIIPCIDSKQNINEFEARRLMEYEYLSKFFKSNKSLDYLQRKFKRYKKTFEIKYDELDRFIIKKQGKICADPIIKYLMQPKVKYSRNSQLYKTIWNIDNLNFNKELYLTEGFASLPKIWTYITKNCSCTYGSEIDIENQIKILKKFKKIILIPDPDIAGFEMTKILNAYLSNLFIKEIKEEDTDNNYIEKIKETKEQKSYEFMQDNFLKKFFK